MGFFSCMTILSACKEKDFSKSVDGIPEVDNINTFAWEADSFSINHNLIDTLITNDVNYPVATIGKIDQDPFFGKTNAGLYVQFSTSALDMKFPAGLILDSTVLSIPYYIPALSPTSKIFYGDTAKNLVFNVHRINEEFKFDKDKQYFAFDQLGYDAQPIAQKSFKLNEVFDTLTLADGVKVTNVLRIKLPQSFGQEIVNLDPEQYLKTAPDFQKYFPGFYIHADQSSETNALAIFNISDGDRAIHPAAQILLYYHMPNDTVVTNTYFPFVHTNSAWFNSIKRDYTGVPAQQYLNAQNSDSIIVQGAPGISSIIEIPIDKIGDGIINKAQLTLTVNNVGGEHLYLPPNQIIVRGVNDIGENYNIADFVSGVGFTYIGGTSLVEEHNGNSVLRYKFNMPREVQRLKQEGKKVLRIRISAATAHLGFYRSVFYGPKEESGLKPDFKVIYSIK